MNYTKSKQRVADHGEVFTPPWMVEAMLDLVKEIPGTPYLIIESSWEFSMSNINEGIVMRAISSWLLSVEDAMWLGGCATMNIIDPSR